uniref:LRR-RLK n=1 Tax=Rhizophora mucronata TaxID=61149 RepID=A0A2P2KMH5_RHIMU
MINNRKGFKFLHHLAIKTPRKLAQDQNINQTF